MVNPYLLLKLLLKLISSTKILYYQTQYTGDCGRAPLGNDRKSSLPPVIECALVKAMGSSVNLACAEMEKQPERKDMIDKLSYCCFVNGPKLLKNCQYKCFANNVKVISGNSNIEEQRAIWTTYNNINTWFNTIKI